MVEEVALESLRLSGRFVRRVWLHMELNPGCVSKFFPLILHRNLAFVRRTRKAVLEKIEYGELSEWSMVQHSKCCVPKGT